jgi:hypothetical protein
MQQLRIKTIDVIPSTISIYDVEHGKIENLLSFISF